MSSLQEVSRPVSPSRPMSSSRPVSSSLSAQARAAEVVDKLQQRRGSDPDGNLKGFLLDKPKSLDSQLDTMAEQLEKLKSHYEEQSKVLQCVWRMDMNFRDVNKRAIQDAEKLPPPPVAAPAVGNRWAEKMAARNANPMRRASRLVTKSSVASSKRNSVSEAGSHPIG